MRVAFLGLGLIGGSVAGALREAAGPPWRISAWTPNGTGPRAALAAGAVDAAPSSAADAVDGAELIVLAAPPIACQDLLRDLAGPLRAALPPDAVITDVASTKQAIVTLARDLDLRFVGGHPMAGRETAGFGASDPAMFRGRPWVIVPADDAPALARVEALAVACGARPIRIDAADHDAAVAGVSHLPLVLAAALVEAVAGGPGPARRDWPVAAELAASGWAGMTRLARGDVTMGTEIATTNAPAIAARLRDFRDRLDEWIERLETEDGPDAESIRMHLAAAKSRLGD